MKMKSLIKYFLEKHNHLRFNPDFSVICSNNIHSLKFQAVTVKFDNYKYSFILHI